ncbi:MAG: histone deacetylase [Dehalococcoidia bacterium]|nr:MAG: histone deacetylase [Dehalococcoidia bacterium]
MPTGYVFEEIFTKHNLPGHPEHAGRLAGIMEYLDKNEILSKLTHVPSRPARREELIRCHQPRYIEFVEKVSQQGGGMLDPDTYANEFSYDAALRAAGGMIDLTAAVVKRTLDNGFALVRPPGHHATPGRAMGFCLFGTVAIAARAACQDMGLERVAIVDFDVHHGNGTQAILEDDPAVLFISSHQSPFYPGTGSATEIGLGQARGTKVNIPLPAKTGDEGFKKLYTEIAFPILRRFQPQLILVSVGFDAHWKDPLANIELSLAGYHWLCQSLVALAAELCQGRIVFTLEGGYDLEVLAPGVGNIFRVLLGEANNYHDNLGQSFWAEAGVSKLITQLKQIHDLA